MGTSARFQQAVLALDLLNWVLDIVMTAHANKIGLTIIFRV